MTLESIDRAGHIGRKQLSNALHLGEGITRNLISRLLENGLIESSRQGVTLTEEGKNLLDTFNESLFCEPFPETEITVSNFNYAALVKGGSSGVNKGIEQRDAALIAGAQGATTILFKDGEFQMPDFQMLDNEDIEKLFTLFKPSEGDVIIIGTAEDIHLAEVGVKTAALELLSEIS
jgi:hypothetical protein